MTSRACYYVGGPMDGEATVLVKLHGAALLVPRLAPHAPGAPWDATHQIVQHQYRVRLDARGRPCGSNGCTALDYVGVQAAVQP